MIDYTIRVLTKYAVFKGRARRAEYWYFVLGMFVFSFVMNLVLTIVGMEKIAGVLTSLLQLAVLIPSIAVAARRMHDVDRSGWFMLVPFYNIYLSIQPGTVGPNRFGPDPKGTTEMGESTVPMPMPVPPAPPSGV